MLVSVYRTSWKLGFQPWSNPDALKGLLPLETPANMASDTTTNFSSAAHGASGPSVGSLCFPERLTFSWPLVSWVPASLCWRFRAGARGRGKKQREALQHESLPGSAGHAPHLLLFSCPPSHPLHPPPPPLPEQAPHILHIVSWGVTSSSWYLGAGWRPTGLTPSKQAHLGLLFQAVADSP